MRQRARRAVRRAGRNRTPNFFSADVAGQTPGRGQLRRSDGCGDQGRHPLKTIRRQLAAPIQGVPGASLTHDPLVVTQMQPVQYVLGTFPELVGNGVGNP